VDGELQVKYPSVKGAIVHLYGKLYHQVSIKAISRGYFVQHY